MLKRLLVACIALALVGCVERSPRSGEQNGTINTNIAIEDPTITPGMSYDGVDEADEIDLPSEPCGMLNDQRTINIFIENSGSMNGFINEQSDFQNAIQKMIVLLKNYYSKENIHLFYINSQIHAQTIPAGKDPADFAEEMLKKNKFNSVGNTRSTDLNELVKLVLGDTNDKDISILISDCIYSISGKGTSKTLLGNCQNKTMDAFMEKSRTMDNLATLIVRLESHFKGGYWDYSHPSGTASQTLDCERPYYMCVIGSDSAISEFNKYIDVEKMQGYSEKYFLSSKDVSDAYHMFVQGQYSKGKMRKVKNELCALEGVDNKHDVQLAVAVDLAAFPFTEKEKLNLDNYSIENSNYELISVEVIDDMKLSPNDKPVVKNNGCTHVLLIDKVGAVSDFSVKVKRTMPEWVSKFSSSDDTGIGNDEEEQGKTFGIEYFVRGIFDAYCENANDKGNFIEMKFKVKK